MESPEMIEQDRSVPLTELPAWVVWLSIVLTIVPVLPFALLAGIDTIWNEGVGWWLLPAMLVLIVVHEAVHAIAWKFASGLPWKAFRFGVVWKALAPYCHATEMMRVQPYRIGAVAPLIITGVLPLIYGYVAWSAAWVVLGAVAISAAVGDIFVLWVLRDLPEEALVRDHPSNAGCIVLLPDESTNG